MFSADGNVYQWDMVSTVLSKRTNDLITNHLRLSNSAAVIVQDPVWGAYRNYQGDERHFYMGNQQFFLLSMQVVYHTVHSEIFARVLFSRNFAYAEFRENKNFVKW